MVELLLAYGADVNVRPSCKCLADKRAIQEYGSTPLHTALRAYQFLIICSWNLRQTNHSNNAPTAKLAARMVEHFEIVKMLVTCGANLNGMPTKKPCLAICFLAQFTISDLNINKYLLRNGAACDFIVLYRIIANTIYSLDCVSTNFLKLVLLAGCKFDIYFKQLEKETQAPPVYA